VWGSEFTTEVATPQGDSAELVPRICVLALGSVVARARVLVHEVSRAIEITERRRARSSDYVGLEVEWHRAGHLHAAQGLAVKQVDAAVLRVMLPRYSPSPPTPFCRTPPLKTWCPSGYRTDQVACGKSSA
jgi:hypothetical protein